MIISPFDVTIVKEKFRFSIILVKIHIVYYRTRIFFGEPRIYVFFEVEILDARVCWWRIYSVENCLSRLTHGWGWGENHSGSFRWVNVWNLSFFCIIYRNFTRRRIKEFYICSLVGCCNFSNGKYLVINIEETINNCIFSR